MEGSDDEESVIRNKLVFVISIVLFIKRIDSVND